MLMASLGLVSSMRLDGMKDIQSVKSTWLVLHAEFKACVLLLFKGIIKDAKQTHQLEIP